MITYVIIPETGTIVVEDDMDDIAKFTYNEGPDGTWEIYEMEPNSMPVATVSSQYEVWIWVHSIDPSSFKEGI